MTGRILILFDVLSLLLLIYAGQLARGQVFELTLQNFDQFTKDKDVMLVEFYAPWCHHCQEFAPEWEKAASALAVNREFIIGRADCIGNGKELCDRFGVQMYPMVKLFRHGVFQEDYNGDRNADAVVRYLQQAQAQPASKQEDGGWTPNKDPWATGASFQYAYPMTTPPMNPTFQAAKPFEPLKVLQPKPPAPSFATFPTPEWNKWRPATERGEPQPAVQQQPAAAAANGNDLWNIYNRIWNRNKAPAPSLFNINNNIYKPPPVQPEPMQTRVASSSMEYHNFNNRPFEAQTSTYQTGFNNPPRANYIVSSNTDPGTFQGQLSALNNNEGTSFLYIDGKPYVIRRVINRFSNTYVPGQLNVGHFQPFQPFQRFGPGFIRSAQIPHVVRQALLDSQKQKSNIPPVNLPGNQRTLIKPSQLFPFPQQKSAAAQLSPRKYTPSTKYSPTAAWQRFNVNKPNYMKLYADYVRSRSRLQPKQTNLQSPISSGRSSIKRLQTYYRSPYRNPASYVQNVLHSREQTGLAPAVRPTIRAGSKYAISIKGIPGSSALAAIKNKAVTNPGFLSDLLSSRSQQYARPNPAAPQPAPKRNSVLFSKLNAARRLRSRYPTVANLPKTDRALLRTKVIRPNLWKTRWSTPARTRANIAYLPQSAFNRLPSWYRPKIGSALVKYVIKAKSTPQASFNTGNKKQSMIRPAVRDVWQKIYSFYNTKNALQVKELQELAARNRQNILARKSAANNARPAALGTTIGAMQPTVNVGSPLLRVRNNQQLKSNSVVNDMDNSEGFKLRMNTGLNTFASDQPTKAGMPKGIPPEMWDKRSHIGSFLISKKNTIPHRPTIAGNWGTLKKKRNAIGNGGHPYYHSIRSPI